MKKIFYFIVICMITSCGDYLKEFSQDLAYARNVKDLDELLIGNGYMTTGGVGMYSGYFPHLQFMDDDVSVDYYGEREERDDLTLPYRNFYIWSDQLNINPSTGEEWKDTDWSRIYEHIGYLNVIVAKLKDFTKDSLSLRNRVEGEARFLRGAYYYLLANLYAFPYVKETARTDMGIPLNLTEDIEDRFFARNSMEETYSAIVADLKIAADKLKGVTQGTIYRVEEVSARILLSRVYLYMGEWQLAFNECEKIAELGRSKRQLGNMNGWEPYVEGKSWRQAWLDSWNTEILFTQGTQVMESFRTLNGFDAEKGRFCASIELLELYSKYEEVGCVDLRYNVFFEELYSKLNMFPKKISMLYPKIFDCFLIRTPEYYLNRAEAAAMMDNSGEAINTLKLLLETRFEDGKYPNIDGLSGEALVKFIREERRRELCFESQRWFDLRRYAVCPKYPEKKSITHPVYSFATGGTQGVYEGSYTLKPYGEDPAWVLPIPGYEIIYNEGVLIDNPERGVREKDVER